MPAYFFNQYLNGWLSARDDKGLDLPDRSEAIQHARGIVLGLLATHPSFQKLVEGPNGAQLVPSSVCVEVCDATNTLTMIRGKLYAEATTISAGKAAAN